jgi:ankyrin repeat protein
MGRVAAGCGSKPLSDGGSGYLRLFKLIPMLMVVGFMAWCTSNRGAKQDVMQVRTEIVELLSSSGLISGLPSDVDLVGTAKRIGPAGMNRLLYESAGTATLPALKWMVKNGADPRNVGALLNEPLLHKVAQQPQFERLEYFLGLGLDVKERGRDGVSLMHVAAQGGMDERVLALLTAKGLSVSETTASGKQPIHMASVKAISVLARAGADVNAKDNAGRTPLHWAAADGKNEQAVELLRMSASVFSVDAKGRTPLHLAALGRSEAVIDTLLAAGAPRAVRDSDNFTPRELAQEARKNSRDRYRDLAEKL